MKNKERTTIHKNSGNIAYRFYCLRNRKVAKASNKEVRIYNLRNRTITKIIQDRIVALCSKTNKFHRIKLNDNKHKDLGKNKIGDKNQLNRFTKTIGIESSVSKINDDKLDNISVISVVDDSDDGTSCNSLVSIENNCELSRKDEHKTVGTREKQFITCVQLNTPQVDSNGDNVNEYSFIGNDDEGLDFTRCGYM